MSDDKEILAKLDGLRQLFMEKFKNNDSDHQEVKDHLKTLNGQVATNTKFCAENKGIKQKVESLMAFKIKGMVIFSIIIFVATLLASKGMDKIFSLLS